VPGDRALGRVIFSSQVFNLSALIDLCVDFSQLQGDVGGMERGGQAVQRQR